MLPTRTYLEVSVGHLEMALSPDPRDGGPALTLLIAFKWIVGRPLAVPGGRR